MLTGIIGVCEEQSHGGVQSHVAQGFSLVWTDLEGSQYRGEGVRDDTKEKGWSISDDMTPGYQVVY